MSDEVNSDEPNEDAGDDADPEERIELTPEQREVLRRTMETLARSVAPKIELPPFTLPESTLRNIAAISRIAETQQAIVANALKPILKANSAWQKKFAVINSDLFKSHALAQTNLNLIASQLTKNIDFGVTESVAKIAAQFSAQQAAWLSSVGPALASIRSAFYPPNLQGIEGLEFEQVEQVVMVDGIPLYGVPRTSTAEALIWADGASKRRDILGRRWKSVSADCRITVEGCTSAAVAPYVPFAIASIDALDAGHAEAAQALADPWWTRSWVRTSEQTVICTRPTRRVSEPRAHMTNSA